MNNGALPNYLRKVPLVTDLYFVGGVPPEISESNLLNFFSQFATVDAITLRPSKTPANKGFAFLRTSRPCNLVGQLGSRLKVMNYSLTLEPAADPKHKMLAVQNKAKRKIFIGGIPQDFLNEQVLAAIQLVGPVEKLTRIRVKSDRTKYCYAIMQHLDHAQQLTDMKTLKVVDSTGKETSVSLTVGSFIPRGKHNIEFLQSKCEEQDHQSMHQSHTQGSNDDPENSLANQDGISKSVFCESPSHIQAKLGAQQICTTEQQQKAVAKPLRTMEPVRFSVIRMCAPGAGRFMEHILEKDSRQLIRLRKDLIVNANIRHDAANIRFNIILDDLLL